MTRDRGAATVAAWERDQLAQAYDAYARRALLAAIRSRRNGGRGVKVFIVSPAGEFRDTDRGGRTRHERAFTRAAYYHVIQVPRQVARARGLTTDEARIEWSLKLTWGKIENRGGRWGRDVGVRMFSRASGRRHVARHPATAYTAHRELQSRAAPDRAS